MTAADHIQTATAMPDTGPCAPGVAVTRLMLTNYRCYDHLILDLGGLGDGAGSQADSAQPFVVFTGANGAGKTNILEAVSYLAPGRGLRGAGLQDITRHHRPQSADQTQPPADRVADARKTASMSSGGNGGTGGWAVASTLTHHGDSVKIGTGIDPEGSSRRVVRINGVQQSGTHGLGDYMSVLWLTPQMDRLFIEGPAGRRKFLDRLVLALTPDHSTQVGAYERAMRERNRLLADGYRGDLDPWLAGLEAQLAAHGVAVAAARLDAVEALDAYMTTLDDSVFPVPALALDGSLEAALASGVAASDLEHDYRLRLERSRPYDTGRMGEGVHKTDLLVRFSAPGGGRTGTGTDTPSGYSHGMPAAQCSTGEQKALLISLILAHAGVIQDRRGAPIMLLDEVAAHLDAARRQHLFDRLRSTGAQVWLTGTDTDIFAGLRGQSVQFQLESNHSLSRLT